LGEGVADERLDLAKIVRDHNPLHPKRIGGLVELLCDGEYMAVEKTAHVKTRPQHPQRRQPYMAVFHRHGSSWFDSNFRLLWKC
jgi:hypothetical protein